MESILSQIKSNHADRMRLFVLFVAAAALGASAATNEITLISSSINNGSFEKDLTGASFAGGDQTDNLQFWQKSLTGGPIGTMNSFTETSARESSASDGSYSAQVNRGGYSHYYGLLGDTGYSVQAGDVFNLSFDWFPSSAWTVTDQIQYFLYTAAGAAGNPSNAILSGFVDGFAKGAGQQTLTLTGVGAVGASDIGESLIIEFNANPGSNNHYSRIDQVQLSVLSTSAADPLAPILDYAWDLDFSDSSFPANPGLAAGSAAISTAFEHAVVGAGVLTLDGADASYVDLTTPISFSNSAPWSVAFWARKAELSSTHGMVMGDSSTATDYIQLNGSATGLRFCSSSNTVFDFAVPLDLNDHHYALSADGAGSLSVYCDGLLLDTLTGATAFNLTSIGRADPSSGSNFAGNLDEVQVYSVALSANEVNTIYKDEADGTIQVLLLGDDTTLGTIPQLLKPEVPHLDQVIADLLDAEGDLPLAHVLNAGKDGEFIQQLFDSGRYASEISVLPEPDYIFFRYGIHDRTAVTDFPADFTQDVEELITQLKSDFPGAVIIPTTVIPFLDETESVAVNQVITNVAASAGLDVFDLYPLYLAEEDGFDMLNIRNYPLEDTPAKLHAYLTQYYSYAEYPGRVLVINNEIDPLLGDLPNWFDDRSPNHAGYWYIGLETANYLMPLLRNL